MFKFQFLLKIEIHLFKIKKICNNNMKNISILPIEIQYKIIEYLHLENSYAFDIDSVYFYAEPCVFIIDNKILVVSVYSWFGVYDPDRYKRETSIIS
jgi:hypothetical protein